MKTFKKLFSFLSLLAFLQSLSFTAQATVIQDIQWSDLTPEFDTTVLQKFQKGEIEQEDVMAYMDEQATTPSKELNGKTVRIPGFLVPLDFKPGMKSTEMLLVPTMGACVHVPSPPANQTVYVKYPKGMVMTEAGFTPYVLEGIIRVQDFESDLADAVYIMEVTSIKEA